MVGSLHSRVDIVFEYRKLFYYRQPNLQFQIELPKPNTSEQDKLAVNRH